MRHKDLIKLIEEGESTTLEFKRKATSPYKLAREISALANTKGGYLLIGVDDNGTIYGVHSEKSEIDVVESACQFEIDPPVEPAIDVINIQGKEIVVVYIEQSRSKPHKMYFENGSKDNKVPRAYIRMGEKSVIA
ncbi:MAG: helix-turn-helix domain-containing protein, partial [Bacteroidota bacterium]